jgi:UDP-2-acetamido-3-amino-2,3-dideoxy-glucuronate N-acetyltransferase
MSDGIMLGVAGAGKWGANHVTTAAAMGVLGAICDADPTLLGNLWARYPDARVTTRFEEMLTMPIDAVVIATPAQTHATLALKAIEAGKHVFVEKPLALTVEDAQSVATAARLRGVKAFVGHLVLYQLGVRAVLDRVRSGSVGEVRHVRARRGSYGRLRFVEDVWWSFAPHDVSSALAIIDDEPIEASIARHAYVTPGIADFAYADFKFSGDRSAHVEVTWLDPSKGAALDVFGTKRTLSLRDSGGKTTLRIVSCGAKRNGDARAELWRGDETTFEFDGDEPLRTELESFIGMILRSESVPSDADAGIKVVRALSMCAPQPTIVHEVYERMPA